MNYSQSNKILFFEKISKSDKSLDRLTKKKESLKLLKSGMKAEILLLTLQKYKGW